MHNRPQSKIVRPADLKADYHLADSTVRGWEQQDLFPRRRKFGPRVTGWFRDEFEESLRRISDAISDERAAMEDRI